MWRCKASSVIYPAPGGVYSTHSPVSRTAQVSVRLRMRTSFPSAHSPFTRFSKQRRKGGQQVPRALCPTHLSRSKCSSPVPPNAPISRQRSCECAVMLRMLRHRIDRPSSRSFPVHSLYISDTQGRTRWEGSNQRLCPADHSAGKFSWCFFIYLVFLYIYNEDKKKSLKFQSNTEKKPSLVLK